MTIFLKIFLSRSTSSIYVGCQFLLLYGVLPPTVSADYIFALMCVGFLPLADFTLSTNSASFRRYAGSDPSFVTALIFSLCVLTSLSALLVLFVIYLTTSHVPHTFGTRLFFYFTSFSFAINMAIPLFHDCGAAYTRIMKLVALSDLVAMGVGASVAFFMPFQALLVASSTRLILSVIALMCVGGVRFLSFMPSAFQWWVNRVRSQPRFIAMQVISVSAGAALFSFPSLFLFSSSGQHNFVQFTFAVAISNLIVSLFSSFFSARTDVLLSASSGLFLIDRLHNAWRILWYVFLHFAPAGFLAVVTINYLNDFFAMHLGLSVFSAYSPFITTIALFAGFFNLSSQVVAMGQRIRGFDNFAMPALFLGVINIGAIYQVGTSAVNVAFISACVSMVGFFAGAILNCRRSIGS